MTTIVTSAPAKVILFGEHGVNRQQPALAAAINRRVTCRVTPRATPGYRLRTEEEAACIDRDDLLAFKAAVDRWRAAGEIDRIRACAQADFFAPTRYVLAHVVARGGPGLDVEWQSTLPIGSGLGSGAAASAALALAALTAVGQTPPAQEIAWLAWQGDVIAHGGVASGLDSGACALGGLTRYTLADGPQSLPLANPLPLVVADTGVRAQTATVNTGVRERLAARPTLTQLFPAMGLLARHAEQALATGDLAEVGRLMTLNQLILEKLGVSCPEIETLIDAAIAAGALGAKLSGSGGGGIIVALTEPGRQAAVAAALDAAGGASFVAQAGASGVRIESANDSQPQGQYQ